MDTSSPLERFFTAYRPNIIGQDQHFDSPYGPQRILYADWTASGRAYRPIEERLLADILPYYGNTHSETTETGTRMSTAYEEARVIIKKHVHANEEDVLLFCGSGMTAAVNKLQRLLGLRPALPSHENSRPLVLVTHMEHHSNYVSWLETVATVEIIRPNANGNVDLGHLRSLLERYRYRRYKIAAVTACSNVTGIETPYHEIASLLHEFGGYCVVDFACSAPYVNIDMHPARASARLDAICFSSHKFLGGPGTPGVLLFNKALYGNSVPDQPGGGTVLYSNPWGGRAYVDDIEQREDGGTPPILQAIKAGMCIRLKEEMGVERIAARETEMVPCMLDRLSAIPGVEVLAAANSRRLPVFSLVIAGAHYNLVVRLLNDRFGIQARGGCSCAGPYGHHLLNIGAERSQHILRSLLAGDLSCKPGWVRLSLHPTMTTAEIDYILDALELTIANYAAWSRDYHNSPNSGEFHYLQQAKCKNNTFTL